MQKGGEIMAAITDYEKKIFANELMKDQNATRAYLAIRSDVKEGSARAMGAKLRNDPDVQEYIKSEMARNIENGVADKDEVLRYLTSVMRGNEKEETLKWIGDGAQTIADIDVSAKDRLKAAELLGKNLGIFDERLKVDVSKVVIIDDIPKGDANE